MDTNKLTGIVFKVSGYFNAPNDFHVDYETPYTDEQWEFIGRLIANPNLVLSRGDDDAVPQSRPK